MNTPEQQLSESLLAACKATLIAVINAALWLRVLIQLYRDDTGYELPSTNLDGSDAKGSAYGAKGGSQ